MSAILSFWLSHLPCKPVNKMCFYKILPILFVNMHDYQMSQYAAATNGDLSEKEINGFDCCCSTDNLSIRRSQITTIWYFLWVPFHCSYAKNLSELNTGSFKRI